MLQSDDNDLLSFRKHWCSNKTNIKLQQELKVLQCQKQSDYTT